MSSENKLPLLIQMICKQVTPGKKMMQKLLYLIERNGVGLGLNYSMHFFGPYSSKLDNSLHSLEARDIINIDTSGTTHIININPSFVPEYTLSSDEQNSINKTLDMFASKTALELEALTTLDYVARNLFKDSPSDEMVVQKVKEIKGSKFSTHQLIDYLSLLKESNLLH